MRDPERGGCRKEGCLRQMTQQTTQPANQGQAWALLSRKQSLPLPEYSPGAYRTKGRARQDQPGRPRQKREGRARENSGWAVTWGQGDRPEPRGPGVCSAPRKRGSSVQATQICRSQETPRRDTQDNSEWEGGGEGAGKAAPAAEAALLSPYPPSKTEKGEHGPPTQQPAGPQQPLKRSLTLLSERRIKKTTGSRSPRPTRGSGFK